MTTRQFSVLGLFFGALFLSACHATGPTFTVDTTSDTVDVNPGDGLCADSAGDCSLRAAIQESNVLPEVQTVALTDGLTYTLSITGTGENLGATGDLDITQGVVISGNATIDADGIDRVVEMRNSSGLVELIGVNLVGGQATNGAAFVANGAGLVSVLEAAIHDNTATSGSPVAINRGSAFLWDLSLIHI